MALKKSISLKTNFGDDVVFDAAYIKVEKIYGDKNQIRCDVVFLKRENDIAVWNNSYFFEPSLNGDNFICQAYKYLKTLPEFAGATDC